uniref:C2 domain-containing protein n=1 Tax=Oreochromis niloticus TaxID=8128 RepID=A0A669BUM7_ORENI
MSLIDLDDDQRWVPTHVNVTVLRAKGLRTKGKHGSRYLYTIIQVGKEKYTTGLVEKAEVPVWNEESPTPGERDLVLTVMHRVLIGLDVFLGQTIIPLDKIFHDGVCPRDEWFKLNSKAGRKEKERGQLQITVQFTRNNMTASMFDLTMKDKPRSSRPKIVFLNDLHISSYILVICISPHKRGCFFDKKSTKKGADSYLYGIAT